MAFKFNLHQLQSYLSAYLIRSATLRDWIKSGLGLAPK
jgi:hypothetical protein